MTDFLDKVINIAKNARSDRIISQAAKEKRDRLLPSFTTYQGIDPKDGTDRVEINGETNSGFNLISNASLSIGERVYLRPNQQGGLQRVDARNRPVIVPPVPVIEKSLIKILFLKDEKLYIGGDRLEPELIYEAPSGYVINLDTSDGFGTRSKSIIVNNYGSGENDWVCQFFIRTTDSIPLLFSSYDSVLYDSQIFYETFTYTYIVLNSTGVIYSKDVDYSHLQGSQIYLGVTGATALFRSISGGYGYFGMTGLMGKLDTNQLEDTDFNPVFDGDDAVYGFGQWQTLAINSATDTLIPLQNKNLYAFSFDAVRTDTLDIALFDTPSESRLVFLETISSQYYYGVGGYLFAMGKDQQNCLLWRRDGVDEYLDLYTNGDLTPVSIPFIFGSVFDGAYSTNQINSNLYVVQDADTESALVTNIKLNTDGTFSLSEDEYKHLGFGTISELFIIDVSFSP